MRRIRAGLFGFLVVTLGCAADQSILSDHRPVTTPAPIDVQAEIRDARFFLAYPDETVAPDSGLQPRTGRRAASSL